MASTISRRIRCRLISSYLHSQFRSSQSSFHTLTPKSLQNSPLSFNSVDSQYEYKLLRLISINHRFMCTTNTKPATVDQSPKPNADAMPSSESVESNSGDGNDGGKESGGSKNTQQGKSVRGGPVSWMSFFLLFCTGVGLVIYYDREKKRHIQGINESSTAVRQGPSVGKAAIGGPFNLIDHNGKPVTDKDFMGKWNLLYFGFTHCPDICPDELQKLASAIDKIQAKSEIEVVPVFISVDPERDTVEQVHEYVKEIHPKLIGLTGAVDEVKKAARAYRVYYMKTEEEGSDYLVDHSIVMYLMDPKMQFVKFFGKNYDETTLADGVIQEIKQHKKVKA